MPVIATVYGPDGKQLTDNAGTPLTYRRADDHRAFISAIKAWWPTGPEAKHIQSPTWGHPPEGAEIWMDGVPTFRYELLPLYDSEGTLTDTKLEWVNITQRHLDAVKAERLERVRARLASVVQPEPEMVTVFRDIVADPIPVVTGTPLERQVHAVEDPGWAAEPTPPDAKSRRRP